MNLPSRACVHGQETEQDSQKWLRPVRWWGSRERGQPGCRGGVRACPLHGNKPLSN